jgi:hypothetical protein
MVSPNEVDQPTGKGAPGLETCIGGNPNGTANELDSGHPEGLPRLVRLLYQSKG